METFFVDHKTCQNSQEHIHTEGGKSRFYGDKKEERGERKAKEQIEHDAERPLSKEHAGSAEKLIYCAADKAEKPASTEENKLVDHARKSFPRAFFAP